VHDSTYQHPQRAGRHDGQAPLKAVAREVDGGHHDVAQETQGDPTGQGVASKEQIPRLPERT